ncbi:MAG: AMP-binding protein [Planctomycetes bacterium]|nr:AMP-binding protein [Planctomycetota bacterium]
MLDLLVRTIIRWLLSLRYRVSISGLEKVAAKGKEGILFLPNHPALIDPFILTTHLYGKFAPRPLADKDQINRFFIRWLIRRAGAHVIPGFAKYGSLARDELEKALDECVEGLKKGENLILWPAGRCTHSYLEDLAGNSAVERILQQYPEVRIVLIRTRGLWGSNFGWSSGREPKVAKVLRKGLLSLLASGIFFAPRRNISIELYEPDDLPRTADRHTINRFIELYYNENALCNTYVPYTIWEKTGTVTVPEPVFTKSRFITSIPETTRQIVMDHLLMLTGISDLQDSDHLGRNLGMDSLARVDLITWLEKEFGLPQVDIDVMQTVGDVTLAACGHFVYSAPAELKWPSSLWLKDTGENRKISMPTGESILEIFLAQAKRSPSKIIIADQASGEKSYSDIVTACLLLKPVFENLSGDYIGIMMPASVAADIFYLAILFSGKTPVMINWTGGLRNVTEGLELTETKHILTSNALVSRITSQGIDLSTLNDHFIFIEELISKTSRFAKLRAKLASYISWKSLYNVKPSPTAVILFTSGSETLPKAVPLTHTNLIANIRDVLSTIELRENDRLIGILPPFHSFGLTGTILFSLCGGIPAVYHPNPMDAGTGARIIEAYRVTLLMGTPTFLNGIVRASTKKQLSSLRLAVTGAEKCSEQVYDSLKENCTNAVVLEGYGVTECSPFISLNDENHPRPFTIGKPIPSLEYLLLDPETGKPLTASGIGILLVRGPNVFGGYLNYKGPSPFTEVQGENWYNTGDLVTVDDEGVLTFCGRLKRFVKLGGEMISLPAIESVLQKHFPPTTDEKPTLAVEASANELHPELILFTTSPTDRKTVNQHIRQSGLSGLHYIRKIINLKEIPILGTGKIDYRTLKAKLKKTELS